MKTRRPVGELLLGGVLVVALGLALLDSPVAWIGWFLIALGGFNTIVFGFFVAVGRRPGQLRPLTARIDLDSIEISSYPFKRSTLYGRVTRVPAARISCVFSSVSDVAFVLDHKEVVFLAAEQKEKFGAFCEHTRIANHDVQEVWSILDGTHGRPPGNGGSTRRGTSSRPSRPLPDCASRKPSIGA